MPNLEGEKSLPSEEVSSQKEEVEKKAAPDLESYIRLNKKVVATAEELRQHIYHNLIDLFDSHLKGRGEWEERANGFCYYYKDKEGNLSKIDIDYKKIQQFKGSAMSREDIELELRKLGFYTGHHLFGMMPADEVEVRMKKDDTKETKKEEEKEFNF